MEGDIYEIDDSAEKSRKSEVSVLIVKKSNVIHRFYMIAFTS
jgi:hypothetical protein